MQDLLKTEEPTDLFELAPDEIEVCLNVKGATARYQLRHWLRPPALEDWRVYERNLRSTVETAENEPEALRFDSSPLEAAAALYDRLFRRAEGYRLVNANNGLTADQVPVHHKEMVVRGLSDVAPATPSQDAAESGEPALFALDAERVEVTLEAMRNGKTYRNLAHAFRAPAAADRVEYSRVTSQALYVRNSQTLKTILPSRLPGLVALYDRLIEQARGYSVQGNRELGVGNREQTGSREWRMGNGESENPPLPTPHSPFPILSREAAIRHMDPLHKKVAVQLLFGDQ